MLKISDKQKELLLRKLCPLGRVPKYDGANGTLEFVETTTRRFIHDGCSVYRMSRSEALANKNAYDPSYLGFGINEALSVLIQDDLDLYRAMFDLCAKIDDIVRVMVMSCEQAAVLFNHNSFGDRLFPHIHARSSVRNGHTLSIFYNLTQTSEVAPVLTFSEPVFPGHRCYESGYTKHQLLAVHERRSEKSEIHIRHGDAVIFDAANVPHSFTFTDDIWLTFVYDHAHFTLPKPREVNFGMPIRLLQSGLYYHVFPFPL